MSKIEKMEARLNHLQAKAERSIQRVAHKHPGKLLLWSRTREGRRFLRTARTLADRCTAEERRALYLVAN